jgi:Flp pilus assembly protein TadG
MPPGFRFPFQGLVRDRTGSATVEFVVSLPLIMAVLALVSGLGQALWYHHIVSKGVRDGTRYLSRAPDSEFATYAERARYLAMTGSADTSASPLFAWWSDIDTVTVSGPVELADAPTFRQPFERIALQAVVPVELSILGLIGQGPTITITAVDQARYIGD